MGLFVRGSLLFLFALSAWADVTICLVPDTPNPTPMPRLDCFYRDFSPPTPYVGGHTLQFDLFPVTIGPPLTGATIDSFFDVFTEITLDALPPVAGTGHVHFQGLQVVPGVYQTEMLQLDLNDGGLLMIREAASPPAPPSQGSTQIQDVGGMFHIDSFFDVFTELSLDGGQTWQPSLAPTHLNYINVAPEPASFWMLLPVACIWGASRRVRYGARFGS